MIVTVFGLIQSVSAQDNALEVQWTTYLGGSGDDQMRDLCIDNADNVYVCGVFTSGDFPRPANVPTSTDTVGPGGYLASFSPDGRLRWLQYFECIEPHEIAISEEGVLVMVGSSAAKCGIGTAVVATFNPFGERLTPDVLLAGSGIDIATSVDITGTTIYVGGITTSRDFPVTVNAYQSTYQGDGTAGEGKGDGFVAKFTFIDSVSRLQTDVISFFGGRYLDEVLVIRARESLEGVYIGGRTRSDKLPGTPGASFVQDKRSGTVFDDDGFVASLDTATLVPRWSMFCGGLGDDVVYGLQFSPVSPIPFDNRGVIRVCGKFNGGDFITPGQPGSTARFAGGSSLGGDAFYFDVSEQQRSVISTRQVSTTNDDMAISLPRSWRDNLGPLLFTNGQPADLQPPSMFDAFLWEAIAKPGTESSLRIFRGSADEVVLDSAQERFGFSGFDVGPNSAYICGSTTSILLPGTNAPYPIFQSGKAGNQRTGYLVKLGCGGRTTSLSASTTVLCNPGETATLSFQPTPTAVTWADGVTEPSRVVSSPGSYKVKYSIGECDFIDSIVIRQGQPPSGRIEPLGTVFSCDTSGILLTIRDGVRVDRVAWSNGVTTSDTTLRVRESGTYRAVIFAADGCSITTQTVTVVSALDGGIRIRTSDSLLCAPGDSIRLSLEPSPANIVWDNGVTGPTRVVASEGTYRVRYTVGTCELTDSVVIRSGSRPIGRIEPTGTVSLCDTAGIVLSIRDGDGIAVVFWSNGVAGPSTTLRVTTPGRYSAVLFAPDGCKTLTDTVTVLSASSNSGAPLLLSYAGADSATVGSTVTVVLRVPPKPGIALESLPTEWSAMVRFDKTMLFPIEPLAIGVTDDTVRSIRLSGRRNLSSDTLGTFELSVALGERDSTGITVDSLVFDPCNSEPKPVVLPFRTAGICRLDSVGRFITTRQPLLRTSVMSNPVGSDGAVGIASGGDLSRATARIVTLLGEEIVLTTLDSTGRSISWSIPPSLPSGRYLFVVHTGSAVASSTFEVVR